MTTESEIQEGEFKEMPEEKEPKKMPTLPVPQAPMTAIFTIPEMKGKRDELSEFYKAVMVKDVDFGLIPGTPKPSLYKSGAEMLCLRFGLSPRIQIIDKVFDVASGFVSYDILCQLFNRDGLLVGEGIGSCNNYEDKHRFRWLSLAGLKTAGLVSVDFDRGEKGTYQHPPGFEVKWFGKWPKYRIENKNPINVANTIFKIAGKRAFVDAVLRVTGAGRIFTQDLEDLDGVGPDTQKPRSAVRRGDSTSEKKDRAPSEGDTTPQQGKAPTAKPQSSTATSRKPVEKAPASSKPIHPELAKVELSPEAESLAVQCPEHGEEWQMIYHAKQKRSFICHPMPQGICYFDKQIKAQADAVLTELGLADIRAAAPFFREKYGTTWSAMRAREKLAVITLVDTGDLVISTTS